MPSYFFTKTNLADVRLVVAEARLARGLDPAADLARARELARLAETGEARNGYTRAVLGRAALLQGEWALGRGEDPAPALREAREHFQESAALRGDRAELRRGRLRVGLAELAAAPAWNARAFEALARDLSAQAGDAEAALLLGRLQALGARRAEAAARPRLRAAALATLQRCAALNPNLAHLAQADLRALGDPLKQADARPAPSSAETTTHGL
jgi:hypothetical protein